MKQSFHSRRTVKTSKDHNCTGCLKVIPKGTKVMYGAGIFEGHFYRHYLCDLCTQHIEKHWLDFVDGWSDGDIGESRREAGEP